MGSILNIQAEAAGIISSLAESCSRNQPLGSMSEAIYCSAWVSMVSKQIDGDHRWLFPQSFQYLRNRQSREGGWDCGSAETGDVDSILNTMASLLSILKHRNNTEIKGCVFEKADLDSRAELAATWLKTKLESWDVTKADHVAFEILIPTHLELLRAEGVDFQFPGSKELYRINAVKMDKFTPEILYGTCQTTLFHSLEAFIGKIDFNKVKHRLQDGSMMNSPSSTAAYMIYSSQWDDRAEQYLNMVLDNTKSCQSGAVPSAYPSEIFDISWVLSTLMGAGFTPEDLGPSQLELLADYLDVALIRGGGIVGFTSGVMPDADDTAKSISSLYLLGRREAKLNRLIETFKTKECFHTYEGERNSSFSANCNVLLALLHAPEQYSEIICEIVQYLSTAWFNGSIQDKWNSSQQYSFMLLSEGLAMTLLYWDRKKLTGLSTDVISNLVSPVLAQLLSRTLLDQNSDGSWGPTVNGYSSCEVTAYGILTVKALSSLPFLGSMELEISNAIEAGRQYLLLHHSRWTDLSYVWIEKVTYGSRVLAQTYCLAAMNDPEKTMWTGAIAALVNPPMDKGGRFIQFFSRLPIFSELRDQPTLKLSILEGYLLLPRLKAIRLEIFPRKDMAEDKWLEYIPFTWTCCNYLNKPVNTQLLIEMMILSMLNYQADEFMEAFIGANLHGKEEILRHFIIESCSDIQLLQLSKQSLPHANGTKTNGTNDSIKRFSNGKEKPNTELSEAKKVLRKYIYYVLTHPAVLRAPAHTQKRLSHELATFLCAHLLQNSDNLLFEKQLKEEKLHVDSGLRLPFANATTSFHQWVRTTSANHTSGPFSWIFFECLIGGKEGEKVWRGAKTAYLAEDIGRRLSTMCRMYNDYGSAKRDRAEANVNSLDFPEFYDRMGGISEQEKEDKQKDDLMYLAEYERHCLNGSMERLGGMVERELLDRAKLFVNVTDFYGQIYVARDIASRMK